MKKISILPVVLGFSLLTSCASLVNGTHQSISVHTTPVDDAQCSLKNNKGKWLINKTPAQVSVQRSEHDLVISCKKEGYDTATSKIKSKTSSIVYGNLLFGGIIGGSIDKSNGSAYEYPAELKIPLAASKKK